MSLLGGNNWTLGYFWGNEFAGTGSTPRVRLKGPELGIQLPMGNVLGLVSLAIEGTSVFAGELGAGGNKGTMYRVMLIGKSSLPQSGWHFRGGAGFAQASAKGTTSFDRQEGLVYSLGLGKGLGDGYNSSLQGTFHADVYFGEEAFRGWSIGLGIKF